MSAASAYNIGMRFESGRVGLIASSSMSVRRATALALLAVIAAGCSGDQALDDERITESEHSFGLLSVTYTHDMPDPSLGLADAAPELTTTAQFVRYGAMRDTHVARLLALPLDPDRDLPAIDTCEPYDLSANLTEDDVDPEDSGHVELLEAGKLQIQTATESLALVPRHFPWLLPFISGVVYGEASAHWSAQAGHIVAEAAGGEGVGAFRVDGTIPPLPHLLRLGDGEATGEVHTANAADPLALTWLPARTAVDGDLTYIEVRDAQGDSHSVLRCAVRDDGAFELSRSQLLALTSREGGRLSLEAARLRRTPFSARGLDHGELLLTVRSRLTFVLP